MGSDDLFHKRGRRASDLKRRRAKRAPYKKVLIVCEGKKTEPNYFNALKDHYELNSANVEINGESGSSPAGILKYAKRRYLEEKNAGDPFDKVFCVFDKDSHTTYAQTRKAINELKPKDVFHAITSVPCFEYWLLLHFTYTTKPYNKKKTKSSCQQVLDDLTKYVPEYVKGAVHIFDELQVGLETAKKNAAKTLEAADRAQTENPSTRVHELVDFLENIKR